MRARRVVCGVWCVVCGGPWQGKGLRIEITPEDPYERRHSQS